MTSIKNKEDCNMQAGNMAEKETFIWFIPLPTTLVTYLTKKLTLTENGGLGYFRIFSERSLM